MIVHLNGWPGVGKKTIGQHVARILDARFVHNHLLHDVAIACCGASDPSRWALYEDVRAAAYAALSQRPREELLVMTNALCKGSPRELDAWRHVVGLAMDRQVPLVPIVLTADEAENVRRVQSADRVGRKLTDPVLLRSFFAEDAIQVPDVAESWTLDTTGLTPEEAAAEIARYVRRIAPTLRPAGAQHRTMR